MLSRRIIDVVCAVQMEQSSRLERIATTVEMWLRRVYRQILAVIQFATSDVFAPVFLLPRITVKLMSVVS